VWGEVQNPGPRCGHIHQHFVSRGSPLLGIVGSVKLNLKSEIGRFGLSMRVGGRTPALGTHVWQLGCTEVPHSYENAPPPWDQRRALGIGLL